VRTDAELNDVIANNPFAKEAKNDPSHLVAMFLKRAPGTDQVVDLEKAIAGPELIRVQGRTAYIVYPNGIGRSKLTNALIDRKLQTRGTGRNWNTVLKLAQLCRS
jgi:uncharacterized protein (DUF1697 family)